MFFIIYLFIIYIYIRARTNKYLCRYSILFITIYYKNIIIDKKINKNKKNKCIKQIISKFKRN